MGKTFCKKFSPHPFQKLSHKGSKNKVVCARTDGRRMCVGTTNSAAQKVQPTVEKNFLLIRFTRSNKFDIIFSTILNRYFGGLL